MIRSSLVFQIEDLIQEAINDARDEWVIEQGDVTSENIGEALSELDRVTSDTWCYHLDNHTGPIAYCENKYCTYDRVGLVADILRGE